MVKIKFKTSDGKALEYWVTNRQCLKLKCFAPGRYEHRGATLAGSRNTGNYTYTCMTNAYWGCPEEKILKAKE